MQSDAYINANNPEHKNIEKQIQDYFKNKYSDSTTDATGHNIIIRKAWRWRAVHDERTCYTCAGFSGNVYEDINDIPKHPHHENCRCWIEEIKLDDSNNVIIDGRKKRIVHEGMNNEGGYVDNPKLIDQPTNIGITKTTLDKYNTEHPNFNFPKDVKQLTKEQIEQIYGTEYYDKRNINEIKNERIANAVFDMGVMSNFNNVVKIVQKTLNESMGENLTIDGKFGDNTINVLNNISSNEIGIFMQNLKNNRIGYLRGLSGWEKYGKGWANRTNRY
jgi:hypothetical protein